MMDSVVLSPVMKAFLAGSASGTCSTIIFQPLDLVKTRMQNHHQCSSSKGMVGVATEVVCQNKVLGLWRGLVPSVARTVPGVGIYFSSVTWMKNNLCGGKTGPVGSAVVGAMGRTVAGVAMIPVTVVKTRFESGVFHYSGVTSALYTIARHEGVRGLGAGLLPTLVRDAPFSGIYLMFYDQLKTRAPAVLLETAPNMTHFLAGVAAGLVASTVTHPADVVKTKMQVCSGRVSIMETSLMILSKEGTMGFLRGLSPRALRRTMMAALAWTVYEHVMRNVGLK